MSIPEIINEIDAYVVRLRNARDLLLAPMKEARRKSVPRRKREVRPGKTGQPLSSKPQIREDELRFYRITSPVATPEQRVFSPSRVRSSVAPHAAATSEPLVAVPVQKPQRAARLERLLPPDRKIFSTRTERRPVMNRAFGATLEYAKPAVALAGPVGSKIVVVSAEQAQRDRERATQSAVQRPRVPAIGLTGRAAFEALFHDGSDASKTRKD
jgi:hypothetical protein